MSLHSLRAAVPCAQSANWAANQTAYVDASTDSEVASWWDSSDQVNFAHQLGSSFGADQTGFACGIGLQETCTLPGCSLYQENNDPIWSYEALVSVVNLNQYFNDIFTEVTNAQADFTNLIPSLVSTFFPPQSPSLALGTAAPWITALIAMVFGLGAFLPTGELTGRGGQFGAAGVGDLVTAGFNTAIDGVQSAADQTLATIQDMETYSKNISEATRNVLSNWANTTFAGQPDVNGNTILDYIQNGTFVSSDVIPPQGAIEEFYSEQFIARYINQKWRTQPIFATFTYGLGDDDTSGPDVTKYNSSADDGVYYLYQFVDDGVGSFHLQLPFNLNNLSQYHISGADITGSSAGAFRIAGLNFTTDDELSLFEDALTNSSAPNPYLLRTGWPGTWTFPVCDTGSFNWNSQYNAKNALLPCCCGVACQDTKAFVNASNLLGVKSYLVGCRSQLANTGLDFESIDYGFTLGRFDLGKKLLKAGEVVSGFCGGMISISLLCALGAPEMLAVAGLCSLPLLIIGVPLVVVGKKYTS